MKYFNRKKISLPEVLVWWGFFSIILFSFVLKLGLLQNFMLGISFVLGITCLYFMVKLSKKYEQNKKEVFAWGYRFLMFKVVPVMLPILFRS